MKKIRKISLAVSILLVLAIPIISCEQETGVLSESSSTEVEMKSASTQAKPLTLSLKKVSSSIINKQSLATLKEHRPALYKKLLVEGNKLRASKSYTLYEGGHLTVIISAKDVEEAPEETPLTVTSGYERVPIDIIGNAVLYAVCQCEEGDDDCKFERDERGNLGECTGGACGDCRGGFEMSDPDGNIAEVQASF